MLSDKLAKTCNAAAQYSRPGLVKKIRTKSPVCKAEDWWSFLSNQSHTSGVTLALHPRKHEGLMVTKEFSIFSSSK